MTTEQIDQLTKTILELGAKAVPSRSVRNRLYFQALNWTAELGREKQRQAVIDKQSKGTGLIPVWDGGYVSPDGSITIRRTTTNGTFRWQVEYLDRTISARCLLFRTKREAVKAARSVVRSEAALRFAKCKP